MSEAPERIWVGVSELGDLAINHKGEKLNGYDHVEYIRADAAEAKLATCEKYRDAYAECDRIGTQAVRDLEVRLAKAHEKEIAVWSENYAAMERKLEAARADTKKAEAYAEELEKELRLMKTAGIVEVAVRNPSVMEYMKHWEGRAETAEATLAEIEGTNAP
jgi:hypothetical protein